jgi:hypothetical protein
MKLRHRKPPSRSPSIVRPTPRAVNQYKPVQFKTRVIVAGKSHYRRNDICGPIRRKADRCKARFCGAFIRISLGAFVGRGVLSRASPAENTPINQGRRWPRDKVRSRLINSGAQSMTLQGLNDSKHWRDRAAEMRVLLDEIIRPSSSAHSAQAGDRLRQARRPSRGSSDRAGNLRTERR